MEPKVFEQTGYHILDRVGSMSLDEYDDSDMEKQILTSILSRLDSISDRLTDLSTKVGKVEERISSIEEKLDAQEAEGTALWQRQSESDVRITEILKDLKQIRDKVEEQGEEISGLKRSIHELREQISPLLNFSKGFENLFKLIAYSSAFVLFALFVYLIVSGAGRVSILDIFSKVFRP